jgi:type II secretion system protein I
MLTKKMGHIWTIVSRGKPYLPGRAAKPRFIRSFSVRQRSYQGFMLLEVMVSLAILATAFVAVLKLHSDSIEMLITSRIHTKGAELAQYKMTEIELVGPGKIALLSGEFEELAPDYTWNIDIETTPSEQWKKVTVSVKNKNMRGGGQFQLVEYMSVLPIPEESRR